MICYGVVVAAVLARVALVQALHFEVIGLRYMVLHWCRHIWFRTFNKVEIEYFVH